MRYWYILILMALVLFSCTEEEKKETASKVTNVEAAEQVTPTSDRDIIDGKSTSQYTGKPGRLIVVTDNTLFTEEVEELIDSVFAAPIRPYYPATPYFEVFQRSPKEFERLSTRLRNVIRLTIDEKVEKGKPVMRIYENYYAKTQLFTDIKAHDFNDLYEKLSSEINYLFSIYDRQEWKREFYRHPSKKNEHIRGKIKEKFAIDLVLPSQFRYESVNDEYAIILFPDRSRQMDLETTGPYSTSKTNFIQSGVMIWQYPYTDERQLYPDNLMMMRDTILKHYAKHEIEGVYMGTQDHPAVLPVHEKIKIGQLEGTQFRGLFKFTGEFEPSGGRFWSFHFKHPHRETIVAVSGYIDAPPTMSVSFDINRIRAIIYSIKALK